jgi:hypothetical protein
MIDKDDVIAEINSFARREGIDLEIGRANVRSAFNKLPDYVVSIDTIINNGSSLMVFFNKREDGRRPVWLVNLTTKRVCHLL